GGRVLAKLLRLRMLSRPRSSSDQSTAFWINCREFRYTARSAELVRLRVWSLRKSLDENRMMRAASEERSMTVVATGFSDSGSQRLLESFSAACSFSSRGDGRPLKKESKRPSRATPSRRLAVSPSGL